MTWALIAHRSELAQPGDYVILSGGGEQLLACSHEGEIIVSDNVCLHRGSRIFSGTHGNAPLVCPYHGFKGEAIQKPKALTAWVGDWLFAGDESEKLADQLHGLSPVLEIFSRNIAKRHAFDMLPMSCDWRVAVENTLEDLHVPSVHKDTFGKLKLSDANFDRFGRNSLATYKIGDEHTLRGLKAMSRSFEDVAPDEYFHIFLWPNTCLSSAGGFTFSLQHYLPSGGFTMLHSRLYQGRTKADAPNLGYFFDEAWNFNRLVFQQDAGACANVRGQGTYLTPSEERVKWFRETPT